MINHTENNTTVTIGQSTATVIADTQKYGHRITTVELVYPRYIHSELLTHRMFSRNASSSRATPLRVTCSEAMFDPVFFDYVGLNKSGMVEGEELSEKDKENFKKDWGALSFKVAAEVYRMSLVYNVHKGVLNRALEPFLRIRTLVTATDWENFFNLRLAEDAQPEMRNLALSIRGAVDKSIPKNSHYHVPYVDMDNGDSYGCITVDNFIFPKYALLSAARCARVSYARLDGKPTDDDADTKLASKLLNDGHMSPFEHCAEYKLIAAYYGNLYHWRSYRNVFENTEDTKKPLY